MGLLILATIKSFLDEFCKKNETANYKVRHRVFMEYAYQHLFKRQSRNWNLINESSVQDNQRIEPENSRDHIAGQILDETTFDSPVRTMHEVDTSLKNKEARCKIYIYIYIYIAMQRDTSAFSLELTRIEIHSKIKEFPEYEKRGMVKKIKWILLPFSRNLKEKVIIDAMFYPQRFIAPLLIGIVIFIYLIIVLYNIVMNLIEK